MPGIRKVVLDRDNPEYLAHRALVGAVVRRWRRIRRLSQPGLAKLVGCTHVFVRYVESARRSMTLEMAVLFANALNIQLSAFTPELRIKLANKKPVRKKAVKIPMRSEVVRQRAANDQTKSRAA
jgi:transcriptional regulator with XRE-family HTH domain